MNWKYRYTAHLMRILQPAIADMLFICLTAWYVDNIDLVRKHPALLHSCVCKAPVNFWACQLCSRDYFILQHFLALFIVKLEQSSSEEESNPQEM